MAHHLHYTDLTAERDGGMEGEGRKIDREEKGGAEPEWGMDGARSEASEEEKINYRSGKMEGNGNDAHLFSFLKTLLNRFQQQNLKFPLISG